VSGKQRFTFYEFFAGGGMARAGLGARWKCLFANDCDPRKTASYAANWGTDALLTKDVAKVKTSELPGRANLIWASFPCQDLSIAGMGAGLNGARSGTFWPFWNLVEKLKSEQREPDLVVLENVCGALTSHGGKDFAAIANALAGCRYRFGVIVIDAALFVPQSRPRLFIVGIGPDCKLPADLVSSTPRLPWHTSALQAVHRRLEKNTQDSWIWWNLPMPRPRKIQLQSVIEETPTSVEWHPAEQTWRLLSMMTTANIEKLNEARDTDEAPIVGAVYKRMRQDANGRRVQRAEVRFDGVAGCLRTPAGGSSRQILLVLDESEIRSRLISSREAARLMGLPDSYILPQNYNDAYHLTGDGVVVPVVRFLARHLLEPILNFSDLD
jgi:DNA (cytosine-5)-methyltransferase 1